MPWRRPTLLAIGLLAVAVLPGPSAVAQLPPCPQSAFTLAVDRATETLVPGDAAVFNVSVANGGNLPASVDMTYSQPDAAEWSRSPGTDSFTVGAGQSVAVALTLTAPRSPSAPRTARVGISAVIACQGPVGEVQCCTLPASVTATMSATAPPPTVATGSRLDLSAIAFLVLFAAVVAFGGYSFLKTRSGVVLECPEPRRDVHPGKGTSFPVRVQNRTQQAQKVMLKLGDLPEGWTPFLAMPEIELAAGEQRSFWLMLRSPRDARPGDHCRMTLRAKLEREEKFAQEIHADAFVVSESTPVEDEPGGGSGRSGGA